MHNKKQVISVYDRSTKIECNDSVDLSCSSTVRLPVSDIGAANSVRLPDLNPINVPDT